MVNVNKEIFYNAVSKFELPSDLDTNSIEQVLTKYPAFNSLVLLNAVVLNKQNPNLLESKITNTATKVLDRKVLYDLIHKELIKFKENPKIQKVTKPIAVEIDQHTESKTKEIYKVENLTTNVERNDAFQKLNDDLFKDKLDNSKQQTEQEVRRMDAMKKLQEELFSKTKSKEVSRPLAKKNVEKNTVKKSKNEGLEFDESKAKELILQIKTQQEVLVKQEEASHLQKIEELKKRFLEKKYRDKKNEKKPLVDNKIKDNFPEEQKIRREILHNKIKALQDKNELSKGHTKIEPKPLNLEVENADIVEPVKEESVVEKTDKKHNKNSLDDKIKALQEKVIARREKDKLEKEVTNSLKNKKTQDDLSKNENKIKDTPDKLKRKVTFVQTDKKQTLEDKLADLQNREAERIAFSTDKLFGRNDYEEESLDNYKVENVETPNENLTSENLTSENTKVEKKSFIAKKENFLEWLKNKKKQEFAPVYISITKQPITKPIKEPIKKEIKEDIVPFDKVSNIEAEMHKEIKQSTDPLDSFISTQIARKKRSRVNKEEKTDIKNTFATETLAEIYLAQQKYKEAIEVYSTLSIKYPQKSLYFANQIKKIKTNL